MENSSPHHNSLRYRLANSRLGLALAGAGIRNPSDNDRQTVQLPEDLEVVGSLEAELAPPHESTYVVKNDRHRKESRLGENGGEVETALSYAQSLFADQSFTLLSDEGSSAVVLEGNSDKVFKVMKSPGNYSYVENEVAALTILHGEGLAPKPHLLVDAAFEYRYETSVQTIVQHFPDTKIPRVDSGGKWPVVVMDKVVGTTLRQADITPEARFEAFDKFVEAGIKHGLRFGDVEFIEDAESKKIMLIDAGGVGKYRSAHKLLHYRDGRTEDLYPDMTDSEFGQAILLHDLLRHFGPGGEPNIDVDVIAEIYRMQGLQGLHSLLVPKTES